MHKEEGGIIIFEFRADGDASGTPSDEGENIDASPSLLSSKFGLDKTQDIVLNEGTSYPVEYKITDGQVTGMRLGRTSDGRPSLIIDIVPEVSEAYDGRILLEIPSVVLDPNKNSVVFDGDTPTEWKELARHPKAVVLEAAFSNFSTDPTTGGARLDGTITPQSRMYTFTNIIDPLCGVDELFRAGEEAASVLKRLRGQRIDLEGVSRYLISLRVLTQILDEGTLRITS